MLWGRERLRFGGCVIRSSNKVGQYWNHQDSSSLLVLTHSVTLFLWRAIGSASVSLSRHLPLLPLWLLPPFLSPKCPPPPLFFFSASIFHFLLFSTLLLLSVSLLFMFMSLSPSSPLFLPQFVRADIKANLRQVGRRSFTRLRETLDEKRSVRVTIHFSLLYMACDILKVVMTRTHSAHFACTIHSF